MPAPSPEAVFRRPWSILLVALVAFTALFAGSAPARADEIRQIEIGEPTVVDVPDPYAGSTVSFTTTETGRLTLVTDQLTIPWGVGLTLKHTSAGSQQTSFRSTGPDYFETRITQAGTYTIKLNPISLYSGHVPGTGTVRLTLGLTEDIASEVKVGEEFTVDLAEPGTNADLSFTGVEGQRYALDVRRVSTTPGVHGFGSIAASMTGPEGTDKIDLGTHRSGGSWHHIWPLPAGGTWTLHLNPNYDTTGSFTAAIVTPPDTDGGSLREGVTRKIEFTEPGQTVRLDLKGTAGRHPVLEFDAGQMRGRDDRPLSTFSASLQNADGSHHADFSLQSTWGEARTFEAGGDYFLTLDPDLEATGSMTITYRQVKDVQGELPMKRSGTVKATVPAQNAVLTFTATESHVLRLTVADQAWSTKDDGAGSGWVNLRYYRPDGSEAGQRDLYQPGGQHSGLQIDSPVLDVPGTWTLVVDPLEDAVGSVTARADLVPAIP